MAATVDERSVLVPAPDMVWREVGGEMVLLDPNQNKIMGLNGTGGEVWNALDGTRTLAEVASLLAARFDKDADEVIEDVLAFARVLVERGLAAAG